jgi:hypothetical protein
VTGPKRQTIAAPRLHTSLTGIAAGEDTAVVRLRERAWNLIGR